MTTRTPIRTTLAALLLTGATSFAAISPAQADALEDIKQAGMINVGVFADFPPFSSASADMSLKGYDIDVAQYIADSLGVEAEPRRRDRPEPHPLPERSPRRSC